MEWYVNVILKISYLLEPQAISSNFFFWISGNNIF